MFKRTTPMIIFGAFIAAASSRSAIGQEKASIGVSADITGGGNGPNVPGQVLAQSPNRFFAFAGTYPSVDFNFKGEHSAFKTTYAYGFNKNFSDPSFRTNSHSATATFSRAAGPRWKFNLTDSFAVASDMTAFNLLRGVLPEAQDFQFIFNPVFVQSTQTNTAAIGFDHVINPRTTLEFGAAHSLLNYGGDQQFPGVLSDQQRYSAHFRYAHHEQHSGWSLGYSGAQFQFSNFKDGRSHSVSAGFTHQFSAVLNMELAGGPTYIETTDAVNHHIGSNASFVLKRMVRAGTFALNYAQSSGDTSGLGAISDNQQLGVAMNHVFGKSTTFSADVSGIDTRGKVANTPRTRSISAGASVGVTMSRNWSLNWGGLYQKSIGNSLFAFEQERVFVSLRFRNPELW